MNIDEYRAMKAQMQKEQENNSTEGEKPNAQTQQTSTPNVPSEQQKGGEVQGNSQEETKPNDDSQVQTKGEEQAEKPVTVEIDGKELTIDELKNGYLRQSDYTKKTQEAKRKEQQAEQALKFLEQVQQKPELAQQLSQQIDAPYLDPQKAQFKELEDKYFDLYIQNEMRSLHDKYGDFQDDEVLNIAMNERIENLDTAYHIMKSRKGGGEETKNQPNLDEIKEQLRQELMNEMKAQQEANVDTSTVIQSGGDTSPVRDTTPQLSQQELKVARMMGMNNEEYAKWRDIKSKK